MQLKGKSTRGSGCFWYAKNLFHAFVKFLPCRLYLYQYKSSTGIAVPSCREGFRHRAFVLFLNWFHYICGHAPFTAIPVWVRGDCG